MRVSEHRLDLLLPWIHPALVTEQLNVRAKFDDFVFHAEFREIQACADVRTSC